jgi:P4 family phage/plasmid primase-like protien
LTRESNISPQHAAELNSSRIDSEVIQSRGYQTLDTDSRDKLRDLGCPQWAIRSDDAFPGLFVPLYRVTGEYIGFQFKPAAPQVRPGSDKPAKYASPKGLSSRLDVHPACSDRVKDVSKPLWITEGVKKGDSLASRGLAVITLTGVWNWRNQAGALGDWEDVPIKGRTVIVCFDSDAPTNPQVRNAMMRLVGWLRSKGAEKVKYLPVPEKVGDIPVKGVDDYLAAGGTLENLSTYASEKAPEAATSRDAAFSDAFLTDTVCSEALSGRFLYARGLGWMRYAGNRWMETDESLVVEEIRQWVIAHWEDVLEEYKKDQSADVKARMNGWRQVLTSGRLKALASLSRGPLHAEATDFDAHQDLLNCPNGVVDLTTGELLDPDPNYLMTKVTGVPYNPGAGDADFQQALHALPDDVIDWYQVRVGQAFTGHMPSDDLMIVQQGGGENGKSTLAVPLKRAAGSYYVLVSDRVILGNADQHPTEMMELKGARYALMEETPEARQLNVQQLKKVVGTPDIVARKIRQDTVTFAASHSLFVNTNFAPAVSETDHATWRRLAMVRFPYTFRKSQEDVTGENDRLGDPGLRDRCLMQEGPAVAALAWAVRGAVRWYQNDRVFPSQPERVQADTKAWKREGDLVAGFLDDSCEWDPEAVTGSQDMFQAFSNWLVPTGHRPWTIKTFHSRFSTHDDVASHRVEFKVKKVHGKAARVWAGVRIADKDTVGDPVSPKPGINPFS